jgi:haloacetate dehalogenase
VFDGFRDHRVTTGSAEIAMLIGGEGPPLLLLHGFPQNHVMWHLVAPQLARHFTVIVPDLRGYGYSRGPSPDPEHRNYSKRAMAIDMIGVMAGLGHQTFCVAGHDRGGRVAYRLALDHPTRVVRLAVLDILPTWEVWQMMNVEAALRSYHWLLLAQPAPLPEQLIGHDPEFYVRHLLDRWAGRPDALDPAAIAAYVQQFRQPSVIEAACEDYRAGATIDRADDDADRLDGSRISCPLLVLWGQRYLARQGPAPIDVWRAWARDVRDVALDCGHFLAEEEPERCADELLTFFQRGGK